MMPDPTEHQTIGDKLLADGWGQGTLFHAPLARCVWNDVAPTNSTLLVTQDHREAKATEVFVIITQDCDIKAKLDDEPVVGALLCKTVSAKFATKVDRNSARYFLIDPVRRLVAQAKYQGFFSKQYLATRTLIPWPSDTLRQGRFVSWLARRYDRPALPDALVENFQWPIENAFARLDAEQPNVGAAFTHAIHEVRASIPPSEEPPFDMHLVFMVKEDGLSEEEADSLPIAMQYISAAMDPALVILDPNPRILTRDMISKAEYDATRPIYIEYLTYKGDEVTGLPPHQRT